MKRRVLTLTAACLCAFLLSLPRAFASPLTLSRREGTFSPGTGSVRYTYAFPCAAGQDPCSQGINATYDAALREMEDFTIPILCESTSESVHVDQTFSVTCNTDRYVSFHFLTRTQGQRDVQIVHRGHVFAREGEKAGLALSLPSLLGLLTLRDAGDTWLENRQTRRVSQTVRRLVQSRLLKLDPELDEALVTDVVTYDFYPEEDFYLDETENPVFLIQPFTLYPLAEDAILVPIPIEEILDNMHLSTSKEESLCRKSL